MTLQRAPAERVRLVVRAPAAGRLVAEVRGRLPDASGRPRGQARLLARGARRVRASGRIVMTLRLAKRYRGALRRAAELDARARVTLTPARGTALRRELAVRFQARR